jgi:asparagine synthase (glutamine-hydrolysing)
VSLFLSLGWTGDDHTLRTGIKVIPAGQRWTWQEKQMEPLEQSYYPASKLARQPHQKISTIDFIKLSNDLSQPLCRLGESFDNITCPLTGGRDSRLLAALLKHAKVACEYYTMGETSGLDAEIAALVAKTSNLPYEIKHTTASDVIQNWEKGCWQIVRQADGMYPLQLIAGVITFLMQEFDRINVRFWGAGGEIARGFYNNSRFYCGRHDLDSVKNYLIRKRLKNYGGLLRKDGIQLARDYIIRFADQCDGYGFSPLDIPDVFYLYQRVGRRAGSNWRASMSIRDSYSPFCTRAFIETTFKLTPLQRFTEPLHYYLIQLLSPKLHGLPFYSDPWRLQQPILNLLHTMLIRKQKDVSKWFTKLFKSNQTQRSSAHIVTDNMFDRSSWYEAKRVELREICFQKNCSSLWDCVDRNMFDRITSARTDATARSHYLKALYHIATLFYYDTDEWRNRANTH